MSCYAGNNIIFNTLIFSGGFYSGCIIFPCKVLFGQLRLARSANRKLVTIHEAKNSNSKVQALSGLYPSSSFSVFYLPIISLYLYLPHNCLQGKQYELGNQNLFCYTILVHWVILHISVDSEQTIINKNKKSGLLMLET